MLPTLALILDLAAAVEARNDAAMYAAAIPLAAILGSEEAVARLVARFYDESRPTLPPAEDPPSARSAGA
jgi:hypothetical protein